MNDQFCRKIRQIPVLRFSDIVGASWPCVPEEYYDCPWKYFHRNEDPNDRGRRPIIDDVGIMCYLAAYGDMHQRKLKIAFQEMLYRVQLPERINIVDWGCGQGLGSMYLLDYLKEKGYDVKVDNVILIEPSSLAIEYANLYLSQKLGSQGTRIKCVNKIFGDLTDDDLTMDGDAAIIHIYSNILDVEGINIKDLALWLRTFRQRDNYLVCASPFYRSGNYRIEDFFNYLNNPTVITRLEESDKENNKYGNFTYNIRVVKLLAEAASRIRNLRFFTPRQFFAAYRIDTFQDVQQKRYFPYAAFDVYAPYEITSSYKDDVDPIYAVLSNMISRGVPTKASPFIEEELSKVYGHTSRNVRYGTVSYPSNLDVDKYEKCLMLLDEKDCSDELSPLVMTPIGVARLEKTIVEALITGQLTVDAERWKVVVEESDVPCAALAFEDLRMMFTNLVSLSEHYSDRAFPEIELKVVNKRFPESPLHRGAKVYASYEDVPIEDYDLVIDYSSNPCPGEEYVFSKYNVTRTKCYYAVFAASELRTKRYIYTTDLITYLPLSKTDDTGQYSDIPETSRYLEYFLETIFRKEHFRMGQLPILNRALRNRSVIGLLPTGGGKSLTYQLAAMLQPGVTIIVDPLKSLMQDQYDGLVANGIDACTYINSSVKEDQRDREYRIEQSQCLFAFIAPERLCIFEFRKRLKNMYDANVYFSYGVIDEVHCVSEWGQDFRNTYLHLGRNLYNFVRAKNKEVTLFGLTATASFDVLADVERELSGHGAYRLDDDVLVRCEDTNRLELQYNIESTPIEFEEEPHGNMPFATYDKKGNLAEYPLPYDITKFRKSNLRKSDALEGVLSRLPSKARELNSPSSIDHIVHSFYTRESKDVEAGAGAELETSFSDAFFNQKERYDEAAIVFCPHRKNTDVAVDTCADALRPVAPDLGTFYSLDEDPAKDSTKDDSKDSPEKNMLAFRKNEKPIMVATKAFGMGIDKPNVRYTINVNYSDSLEAFVQEAGRAGRDKKLALSTILVSDYDLVSVDKSCPIKKFPIYVIAGHWFKKEDLKYILEQHGVSVPEEYINHCTPSSDLVKLSCEIDNKKFENRKWCNGCDKVNTCNRRPPCRPGELPQFQKARLCCQCKEYDNCKLRLIDQEFPEWGTTNQLDALAAEHGVKLVARNYVYQSPDYQNMWYFFSSSFPGRRVEESVMNELLSNISVRSFITNAEDENKIDKSAQFGNGLMNMRTEVGQRRVFEISYALSRQHQSLVDLLCESFSEKDDEEKRRKKEKRNKQAVQSAYSKAIYRMCCIDFIQDFTLDYIHETYRVVITGRTPGSYYQALKEFYMRYDSEPKATVEAEKAKLLGRSEVENCLQQLTEFIYEKIASKKKRAIDEIRTFCNTGLDLNRDHDWKDTNEELKDYIYYYFNSKYARKGYTADNGEPYSLVDDTNEGIIEDNLDLVFKYMKVVEDEHTGATGNQLDNLKHLQGAVRLILRAHPDNPIINMLNVFCILGIGQYKRNESIRISLEKSYTDAYNYLWNQIDDKKLFYGFIDRFKRMLFTHGADRNYEEQMEMIEVNAETTRYRSFLNQLGWTN